MGKKEREQRVEKKEGEIVKKRKRVERERENKTGEDRERKVEEK